MSKAAELAALIGSQSALSNRNLIINGAMQVAQRGTSSTANGYGSVDRFYQGRGGGTRTYSQESLSSGDPYNEGFRKYFRFTNTAVGSNNATDYVESYTKIEAQDLASSGWNYTSSDSYVTLSFWVRSSVAGTYSIWLRDEDATTYKYGFTYTLTANTWKKVTQSIPGNSNLVFNNDNGPGLRLQWMAFYGSDYTSSSATLNSWTTGDAIPDYATTWNTTTGATFDFTGVQLELGEQATPFEHEPYGVTLQKAKRYYQRWDATASDATSNKPIGAGVWYTSTQILAMFNYDEMRAAPTFTASSTGFVKAYGGGFAEARTGGNGIDTIGTKAARFNFTCGARTAGHGAMIQMNANGDYLELDAEL